MMQAQASIWRVFGGSGQTTKLPGGDRARKQRDRKHGHYGDRAVASIGLATAIRLCIHRSWQRKRDVGHQQQEFCGYKIKLEGARRTEKPSWSPPRHRSRSRIRRISSRKPDKRDIKPTSFPHCKEHGGYGLAHVAPKIWRMIRSIITRSGRVGGPSGSERKLA